MCLIGELAFLFVFIALGFAVVAGDGDAVGAESTGMAAKPIASNAAFAISGVQPFVQLFATKTDT